MKRLCHIFITGILAMVVWPGLGACSKKDTVPDKQDTVSVVANRLPDTLRVATLYGPLSFFFFHDDTMGYDYSLIKDFAVAKNLKLDIVVATSLDSAMNLLDSGKIDVIAYGVPVTAEFNRLVSHCGPEITTTQVLVQRVARKSERITDVTQLVGRKVSAQRNTQFQYRLENLNDEIGGGIDINLLGGDSISQEDIIELVSTGQLEFGIVNSDIAAINKNYYRNLDVSLDISFAQKSAWAVAKNRTWLGDSITDWFDTEGTQRENELLLKRYFELSKVNPVYNLRERLSRGEISVYDALFKKHAARIGWDWRLLAAMCYIESGFNNDLVSWAGARGIMQIMPSTSRAYGVSPQQLEDPATSIELAVKLIENTDKTMAKYVSDPVERRKFVVACYNSGAAHIIDAITLARKYDKNPKIWSANVENALLMKSEPAYYHDPDVKYGYFSGRQTVRYVREVFDIYDKFVKQGIK